MSKFLRFIDQNENGGSQGRAIQEIRKDALGGRKGLSNKNSNECFANSFLQSLANLPEFEKVLDEIQNPNKTVQLLQKFIKKLYSERDEDQRDLDEIKAELFHSIKEGNTGVYSFFCFRN